MCPDRKDCGLNSDAQGLGSTVGGDEEAKCGGGEAGRPCYEFTVAAVTRDHLGGWRPQRQPHRSGGRKSGIQGPGAGSREGPLLTSRSWGWLAALAFLGSWLHPSNLRLSFQGRRSCRVSVCLWHGILPCECVFFPGRIRTPVTWMQDPPCSSTTSPSLITSAKTPLPRGRGSGLQRAFLRDVIPPQHLRSKTLGLLLGQPPRLIPHLQPRPLLLWHSPLPMTRPVRPSASQESEAPTVAARLLGDLPSLPSAPRAWSGALVFIVNACFSEWGWRAVFPWGPRILPFPHMPGDRWVYRRV